MRRETEREAFDNAMDRILKADPTTVKRAMEQEKDKTEEERKAKRLSSSSLASSSRDV